LSVQIDKENLIEQKIRKMEDEESSDDEPSPYLETKGGQTRLNPM
jgi:hypothetical protein